MTGASAVLLCACVFVACERESRRFSEIAPTAEHPTRAELEANPPSVARVSMPLASPYAGNGWAVAEGKRLYHELNCDGCHAQGGGGIGPALMDGRSTYGNDPQSIYTTLVEGRPNGMPALSGRVTQQQLWQLVAYVQALSRQIPVDVRPGRDDHMQASESEQARRHGK